VEKVSALVNTAATYWKPSLATFWYYGGVEQDSSTSAEIPTAIQSLSKTIRSVQTGSFKQLMLKEAMLNSLEATEL
jgi:hypothetical protein